ncbi:enoyl-CoA hydratase-related protein [Nocardia sp. NPDC057353]|uniref:enoyl-CoA hydratase-related protein n=1 Tax=Nocardia sp. NPDC057353 TaxID=3346104 RepID=UPI0036403774
MPESLHEAVPPRTPVIVGVGQASERIGTDGYRALSAADLAADAVRAALTEAGVPAASIDTVAAVRAFDVASPYAVPALGAPDNVPRAVAARVGADPARAILGPTGGQSPQQLLTELCRDLAAGRGETALVFGAETISTVRHLAGLPRDQHPDYTERHAGSLEDRGYRLTGLTPAYAAQHGFVEPTLVYSAMENARRSRLGASRAAYARAVGELFAPFTAVAAGNPHAAAPVERGAAELTAVDARNRAITDVYTRFVVARDQVNQAAAVLVTTAEHADRLGIPAEQRVYLHGWADLTERGLLERPALDRSPAAVAAVRHALDLAGIGLDDVAVLDLYSCFPIAVFNLCDGLGLDPADPRGLTVTGGLPFFGGAGNNYSAHAIAEIVTRLRRTPGGYGLVAANGGVLSKHSVGVYSTTPAPFPDASMAGPQAELDAVPAVPVVHRADGWGTVESWTASYGRDGTPSGIVIGRLDDGRRFLATTADAASTALLTDAEQPAGHRVYVRSTDAGNRVTVTRPEPKPAAPPRDTPHLTVTTAGRVLEIVLDRPNLDAEVLRDLDHVLAGYQRDPELWAAVVTGGDDFSLGVDPAAAGSPLVLLLQSRRVWNGRPDAHGAKPVVAAVSGRADGAGLALALGCDLVVADEAASFAVPDPAVGLPPALGLLEALPRLAGPALARDLILTGRRLTAPEALAAGLIARTAPHGKALDVAREVAADIVARSPLALRAALTFLRAAEAEPGGTDRHAAALADVVLAAPDPTEGFAAYRQGRQPNWRLE